MWHLELQIKYQNNRGCKTPNGAMPQLVQDLVGNRTCRVNPRFVGTQILTLLIFARYLVCKYYASPSRSVIAVVAQWYSTGLEIRHVE